jgi:hypothetical protein
MNLITKLKMINTIIQYFNDISDEEIKETIKEIHFHEATGLLLDKGLVRKHARHIAGLIGSTPATEQHNVIVSILKQGAYRWIKNELKNYDGRI